MKCKLVKIRQLSGSQSSVYSICVSGSNQSLFEEFLEVNSVLFKSETIDIIKRIKTIGQKTGAREHFFKINEGKPGDGVCALYDDPESNLRLYCIRYGTQIIILGGGGHKPKSIRALQEKEDLKDANYLLRELSIKITEKIKDGEVKFSQDGLEFIGDLEFDIEYLD